MNHQNLLVVDCFQHGHALLTKPRQHDGAVFGLQDGVQGVLAVWATYAVGDGQQMQVVIAQQTACAISIAHQTAQHCGRVGPTVDQITQQVQGVAAW